MDHLLMVLLLLCSSGLQAEDDHQPGSQCDSKADIVMLVDGSGSISTSDFSIMKSFLREIVNNVDIGPDKVQIGLVQFSSRIVTEWELNTHQTNQSLLEAISRVRQLSGGTHTGKALQHVLHNNFKPDEGMRADSQKIVVLITDGQSTDNVSLASEHLRDSGIEIYAIGVGDVKKSQLWEITADPAHVYMVDDFDALQHIVNHLTKDICANSSSDLLLQPNISVYSTMDGVSGAQQQGFQVLQGSSFTISCSVQPQYPGGSFQLTFSSSNSAYNYTQPAVNHSADFLFPAANPAHQGNYSCVYGVYVFSHNFSSESRLLSLTVTGPKVFIIRLVIILLAALLLFVIIIYFIVKASRGQKPDPQENTELSYYNLGVSRAEGEPAEEEGAQGAE